MCSSQESLGSWHQRGVPMTQDLEGSSSFGAGPYTGNQRKKEANNRIHIVLGSLTASGVSEIDTAMGRAKPGWFTAPNPSGDIISEVLSGFGEIRWLCLYDFEGSPSDEIGFVISTGQTE